LATLTIHESKPGRWDIEQIKGPFNNRVPKEIEIAAFAVIRTMEDAYTDYSSVRRYLDRLRHYDMPKLTKLYVLDDEMGWYPE